MTVGEKSHILVELTSTTPLTSSTKPKVVSVKAGKRTYKLKRQRGGTANAGTWKSPGTRVGRAEAARARRQDHQGDHQDALRKRSIATTLELPRRAAARPSAAAGSDRRGTAAAERPAGRVDRTVRGAGLEPPARRRARSSSATSSTPDSPTARPAGPTARSRSATRTVRTASSATTATRRRRDPTSTRTARTSTSTRSSTRTARGRSRTTSTRTATRPTTTGRRRRTARRTACTRARAAASSGSARCSGCRAAARRERPLKPARGSA